MLSVKRELHTRRKAGEVWHFVKEMGNWAAQMPGYLSHEITNENDSVWNMQMNLGPFTRPIVMDVHVSQWLEPSEVAFEVKGRFDPFQGKGRFLSSTAADGGTDIVLEFEVEGTGSMAKVISAMAAPVLVTVADQFVANLGAALDTPVQAGAEALAAGATGGEPAVNPGPAAPRGFWARVTAWFRGEGRVAN